MTVPEGFHIIKDEPLLSEKNSIDVTRNFQRLDAVLREIHRKDGSSRSTNDLAGQGNGHDIRSGLLIVRASDVVPKRVDAIWMDDKGGIRVARGEHTIIAGESGLGKSQAAIAAVAAVTRGSCWPCREGRAPLGSVIILAAEDSIEHTIVPRLIAAGADLSRVYFVQAAVTEDGKGRRTFNFQVDLAKLKALVKDTTDAELVIIDPVTAYMGKIDSHKNTEVRGVLAPLGELAQECNVAIVSITHFTKGTGSASSKAIDRIIGSVAFIAAPRIGFTVIADPDDPNRRLLLHVKNNISRPPQGLAFRLGQRVVGSDEKGDFVASRIAWESEPVEKTADEALRADGNKEQTAKADAVEFLTDVLANGPVKVTELEKEAQAACLLGADQKIGQSKPFRSARKALGIEPYQPKGQKAGGWLWALPGDQTPSEVSDALQNKRASDGVEGI
jgi:putative DNA primase/helicase